MITPRISTSRFEKRWYQVGISKKVRKGKIYTFNYFSKSLICFRADDESVHVFDAHCPHLGAHLGVGGKIEGNQLVCPFHGWKFNKSGDCEEIPYCKNIPKRAQLKSYPAKEAYGAIFIYYSEDSSPPETELLSFPKADEQSRSWVHTRSYTVSHYQNAIDVGIQFEIPTSFTETRMVHSTTPINEDTSRVYISYIFNKNWNPLRTLFLLWLASRKTRHFSRSMALKWERPVDNPLLTSDDRILAKLKT